MTDEQLKQLVDNYQPRPKILKLLSNVQLLAVVGATSAGKTTLMQLVMEADPTIKAVGGETSRAPREGDWEFSFITKDKMTQDLKAGKYVQIAMSPNGDLYSSSPSDYPDKGTGVMAILSSVIPLFRSLPFKKVISVFIVPANHSQWLRRLDERQMSPQERQKRLTESKQSYEFALQDKQISLVLNDELDSAAQRLLQAVHGQKPEGEEEARVIAKENYQKLLKLLNRSSNL